MRLREIEALVDSTSDPSFAVDETGCIAAWNGAARLMFGLSAQDAVGTKCNEIVQGTDECGPVCSVNCATRQAAREHHPVGTFDLQVRTANGMQWCNVSVLIAEAENSATPYLLHIIRQIDFRKRLELLVRDFIVTGTGLPGEQVSDLISASRSPTLEADLSARECEVLTLLAEGVTTNGVAERLHISRTTVNNHVQHILRKLDSHSRLEAIRRAERSGLI